MYNIYGIPNCDTVKKAITWLNNHKIPYVFHDYKKEVITAAKLKNWMAQLGWETILNKKSTTWRSLDGTVQATISSEKAAIALLVKNTSGIKRPLIEKGDTVVALGFDEALYNKTFKK